MNDQLVAREFSFDQKDFKALKELVYERSGITLGDQKKDMVYGRLTRRLRELHLESFSDYISFLREAENDSEIEQFINAVTTNLTKFFRENHHFEHVENVLIPELVSARQSKIRLWSAASSSGPEPYSLAMTVHNALPSPATYNVKILATDLDTKMLQTCREGRYDISIHKDIPAHLRNKYTTVSTQERGSFQICDTIRDLIYFNRMNLMNSWPMKGPFDAIFCRNVLIYFNAEDKKRIISQLIQKLKIGGYLYMGHAESILNPPSEIISVGTTTYQRRS